MESYLDGSHTMAYPIWKYYVRNHLGSSRVSSSGHHKAVGGDKISEVQG